MPLQKYEDFLESSVKQLVEYLSVRGLNASGKKVELLAQAFAAFELKMDIIASSEEQRAKLEGDYQEMLAVHDIADHLLIENHKKIDDIKKCQVLSLGNIFLHIFCGKKCATRTTLGVIKIKKHILIGIVNSQKPIFIYDSKLKKDIVCLYSNITASQTMSDAKSLWITVKRKNENGSQIICAWCSCIAGTYETCNHAITCLCKTDYANTKGLCSPALSALKV